MYFIAVSGESQGIASFCENASSCGFKEPLFYTIVG